MSKERTLDERIEDSFSRMYRHLPTYAIPVIGDGVLAYDLLRNSRFNNIDRMIIGTSLLCMKYRMIYEAYVSFAGAQ